MKRFVLAVALFTLPALAQNDHASGYRDCSPKKLEACQDSNQLFFGPFKGINAGSSKAGFRNVLAKFLAGAPKIYVGKQGFSVMQSAVESLTGPGDHHDRLPDGVWFFDGFTPHYAPNRGAVLFAPGGNILAIALVDTGTDAPGANNGGEVQLRIYVHDRDPSSYQLKLLRTWANGDMIGQSLYPGALPVRQLVRTQLITRSGKNWSNRTLP
jgi:hypothetical protein